MLTTNELLCGICCSVLLLASQTADAGSLKSAQRLLAAGSVRQQFETQTRLQARAIIRHYESIVATSAAVTLPPSLKQTIADCYAREYAWDNFAPGIAQIFADNLSENELRLLTGFYSNLGVPPGDIDSFRAVIAKSTAIQAQSLEYLFAHSASCVETDAALILDYVSTRRAATLPSD